MRVTRLSVSASACAFRFHLGSGYAFRRPKSPGCRPSGPLHRISRRSGLELRLLIAAWSAVSSAECRPPKGPGGRGRVGVIRLRAALFDGLIIGNPMDKVNR